MAVWWKSIYVWVVSWTTHFFRGTSFLPEWLTDKLYLFPYLALSNLYIFIYIAYGLPFLTKMLNEHKNMHFKNFFYYKNIVWHKIGSLYTLLNLLSWTEYLLFTGIPFLEVSLNLLFSGAQLCVAPLSCVICSPILTFGFQTFCNHQSL